MTLALISSFVWFIGAVGWLAVVPCLSRELSDAPRFFAVSGCLYASLDSFANGVEGWPL